MAEVSKSEQGEQKQQHSYGHESHAPEKRVSGPIASSPAADHVDACSREDHPHFRNGRRDLRAASERLEEDNVKECLAHARNALGLMENSP